MLLKIQASASIWLVSLSPSGSRQRSRAFEPLHVSTRLFYGGARFLAVATPGRPALRWTARRSARQASVPYNHDLSGALKLARVAYIKGLFSRRKEESSGGTPFPRK